MFQKTWWSDGRTKCIPLRPRVCGLGDSKRKGRHCGCQGAAAAAFVRRLLPAPAAGGRPPGRGPPTIARGVGSRAVRKLYPGVRPPPPAPGSAELGAPVSPAVGALGGLRRGNLTRRRGEGPQRPGRLRTGPSRAEGSGTDRRGGLPWGRRPAPRPRPRPPSGTGATWTAASPATASASPSACGSAPPPAGSPPTHCNGAGTAAPGWGRLGCGGREGK